MKNLIKNRRGIAVEMAVIVMLIFVALSIVMMSVSEMQVAHKNSDIEDFNRKTDLYEITDYIKENHGNVNNGKSYKIKDGVDNDANTLRTYTINKAVESDTNGEDTNGETVTTYTVLYGSNTVLTIKIDNGGKILSWEE